MRNAKQCKYQRQLTVSAFISTLVKVEFQVYLISLISFPWIPFQFQYEVSLWRNVLTMDVFPISVQNTLRTFIILMPNTPLILADSFLFSSLADHYSHSVDAAMHEQYSQLLAGTNDNPHEILNQFANWNPPLGLTGKRQTIQLLSWIIQQEVESTSKLSSSHVCLKFNKLRPHSQTSTEKHLQYWKAENLTGSE